MKWRIFIFGAILFLAYSQFPGKSRQWGQSSKYGSGGSEGSNTYFYGKPIRLSQFGNGSLFTSSLHPGSGITFQATYDDDPVIPAGSIEIRPDSHQIPVNFPINAPNGVVEIYNRVVDDLVDDLENVKIDFERNEIDLMSVVLRSALAGPDGVPGHMQKRPFRRLGVAGYRSNYATSSVTTAQKRKDDTGFSSESEEFLYQSNSEKPGSGSGTSHETPRLNPSKTGWKPEKSEPSFDEYPRSGEFFSNEFTDDIHLNPGKSQAYVQLQKQILNRVQYAIDLSPKWNPDATLTDEKLNSLEFVTFDGILTPRKSIQWLEPPKTYVEYAKDIAELIDCANNSKVQKLAKSLQPKTVEQNSISTDKAVSVLEAVWSSIKVPNMHLHTTTATPMQTLLDYLKSLLNGTALNEKGKPYIDELAAKVGVKEYTLRQVFLNCNITNISQITEDNLRMSAARSVSYSHFSAIFKPFGNKLMKQALMHVDSPTKGIHLANLIKKTLEATPNELVEMNLSLNGEPGKLNDWVDWVHTNGLHDPKKIQNLKFKFQISKTIERSGQASYAQHLEKIFMPILEASRPNASEAEKSLMNMIVGFDSAGQEPTSSEPIKKTFSPEAWNDMSKNPDYLVQIYYFWANIRAINKFRSLQGLNVFSFTPHCGETGSDQHLAGGFLLANYIGHGIALSKDINVVYKLLYTLMHIGATVCPISNDWLYLSLKESPAKSLLHDGVMITLGTDDPTIFQGQNQAYPLDPLLVEYITLAKAVNLSLDDIVLLLLNGVRLSSFKKDFGNIKNFLDIPPRELSKSDTVYWTNAVKKALSAESERNRKISIVVNGLEIAAKTSSI